jgi:hypothetical protein
VIIKDVQWMTECISRFKVSFEINLPKVIGFCMLKTLPGLATLARVFADQAMSVQDTGDGTGGRISVDTKITHALRNLAATPS